MTHPQALTPESYTWIKAWGLYLCSFSGYIRRQQEEACAEGAPMDAIYKRHDGTWARASEISNPVTRKALGLPPLGA